jgi:hypothetical protein
MQICRKKTMTTLRNVLMINGLSSGATGLILAAASAFIADVLNVSGTSPVMAAGWFLIFFAALVLYTARQKMISRRLVITIILLDIIWVIASAIVVTVSVLQLSRIGYSLILAVALWVALMAILQINGLRKLSRRTNLPSEIPA